VVIPKSITTIEDGTFIDCVKLASVVIPNSVTSMGTGVFLNCSALTGITIPNSVTSIGFNSFQNCSSLKKAYFLGNAPTPTRSELFQGDTTAIYFLPGTTGWNEFLSANGLTGSFWTLPYPVILENGTGFGVQTNGFDFTISWATNLSVVVEANANLGNPVWIPVATNALSSGSAFFSDPQRTNYSGRFYRVRSL
jgi:hypothetical protein